MVAGFDWHVADFYFSLPYLSIVSLIEDLFANARYLREEKPRVCPNVFQPFRFRFEGDHAFPLRTVRSGQRVPAKSNGEVEEPKGEGI
jgi:hypothetical protein